MPQLPHEICDSSMQFVLNNLILFSTLGNVYICDVTLMNSCDLFLV